MSLLFADASTDKVSFGNTGTDPTTGTMYLWTYPLSVTTTRRVFDKSSAATGVGFWRLQLSAAGTGRLRFLVDYVTADADSTSNDNGIVANKWQFIACVYDGTNAPKIYAGDLTTPVAELTYVGTAAPSGGRVTDGGGAVVLGNQASTGATSALNQHVAVMNWIPGAALSLGDLRSHQFRPRPHANSKAFSWIGFNGTGTQADWSGSGFNGTVTGTTQSANVPLGLSFGFSSIDTTPFTTVLTPGRATIAITGKTPTVAAGSAIIPGKASLSLTKYAPALNLTIAVPKATLSLTAQPAALKFTLPVAKATLSLTGQVPALKFTLPIPKATVSLTGQAPALKLTLPVAKATLSITGKTPTAAISADRTAQPGAASLTLTGRVPTVTATANVWLTPATKALHLTASLPLAVVTLPGGDPLRNIYRVDQSGLGGDIYKGVGSQTRSGNGNILRSDPSVLTWDEIPGNWDDIAGTFDGTSSSRPRLFKR